MERYLVDILPDEGLHGRRVIATNEQKITADNVVKVLNTAIATHDKNRGEIQYLWDVYRGKQDIRKKEKIVREEINNKITVNIANEIVTFKTAFLLSGPVQYIGAKGSKTDNNKLVDLNRWMSDEDKQSKDKEIVDWICGMPNRNGGSSTSDTGQATIMRDGWKDAESRAQDSEDMFRRSERQFLRVFLTICNTTNNLGLNVGDVYAQFTRNNLTDIQSKMQVFIQGLGCEKIAPETVYRELGPFRDNEMALQEGMKYYEEKQAELEKSLNEELDNGLETNGQRNQAAEPQGDTQV